MDERDELLRRSWEGEVLGEAFFASLTDVLPEDSAAWATLSRLEGAMAALIAPVAEAHAVHIDADAASASGRELAESLRATSRDDVLRGGLALVDNEFLPMYRRLGEILADSERWLGEELVAHEQALASCFSNMLAGEPRPAQAVEGFLARHATAAPA